MELNIKQSNTQKVIKENMGKILEHKPGERVMLNGEMYEVVATASHRIKCEFCALKKVARSCYKVHCDPAFRKDRMKVYYVTTK